MNKVIIFNSKFCQSLEMTEMCFNMLSVDFMPNRILKSLRLCWPHISKLILIRLHLIRLIRPSNCSPHHAMAYMVLVIIWLSDSVRMGSMCETGGWARVAGGARPQAELLVGVSMRLAIYNYKFKCNAIQC